MVPLGLLSDGEMGEIAAFEGGGRDPCDGRAEEMGLRVGKRIEVLSNDGGRVLVKVDESRIAVARRMAMRIVVRRS
jgi:ferrous iron transport protein A